MRSRARLLKWAGGSLLSLLLFSGCFTIPFLNKRVDAEKKEIEPVNREFDRSNVFIGYDKNDRPIVELRLISQELSKNGLLIHTRLFPTGNFKVRNIFRGLRSINYYPIERRFHRLELRYGKKKLKLKVSKNLEVRDTKPVDANFEHSGIRTALPDTILEVKLKFQDVDRWGRLPADSLNAWYAAKAELIRGIQHVEQRQGLLDTYRRRQKKDETRAFTQFDTLYVTTNNSYVYLEKDINSEILYTLNAGEKIDYGMSDGVWVEIPLPDSLHESLREFLEDRHAKALKLLEDQRRAERNRRGPKSQTPEVEIDTTRRTTAYVLDVMVQKDYQAALDWEKGNMTDPVDVPLFAKVLQDREARRQARLDSIEKAQVDSVARAKVTADSLVRARETADSIQADSSSARAKIAQAGKAQADSERQAAAGAAKNTPAKAAGPGAPEPAAVVADTTRAAASQKADTAANGRLAGKVSVADSARAEPNSRPQPGRRKKGAGPPAAAPKGDRP